MAAVDVAEQPHEGLRQRRITDADEAAIITSIGEAFHSLGLDSGANAADETVTSKALKVTEWVKKLANAKQSNASSIDISHLPEQARNALSSMDTTHDGLVDVEELQAAARAKKMLDKHEVYLKRILVGLVFLLLISWGAMFLSSWWAAEVSKETELEKEDYESISIMKDKNGGHAIATAQTQIPLSLSSTLDDSQLKHLKKAAFTSNAGHVLHIQVDGFLRVPLVGSRCGSVVYLITQMGRIMLDDTDVSFENHAAIQDLNAMGFVISSGGIGRRLQGASIVTGFFNALEGSRSAFSCSSIDLPTFPRDYKALLVTYEVCDVPVPDAQKTLKHVSCQSNWGGYHPGATILPDVLFRLTLPETRRGDLLPHADVRDFQQLEQMGRLAFKSEETMIDTTSYVFTASTPLHHYGQHQISLREKGMDTVFNFQVADPDVGIFTAGRKYCSNSTAAMAEESFETMHIEYRGLWVEGVKTYRHWRMLPAEDAAIAFGGSMTQDEVADFMRDNAYEYFDIPESFIPFRIVSPSNTFHEYHNFTSASDSTVEDYLQNFNIAVEDALAPECYLQRDLDAEVPQLARKREMDDEDMELYAVLLADSPQVFAGAPSFTHYFQRVLDPLSLPDFCMQACSISSPQVQASAQACLSATKYDCLINHCGFEQCRRANLVDNSAYCSEIFYEDNETNSSRRLTPSYAFGPYSFGNFGLSGSFNPLQRSGDVYASGCGWPFPGVTVCGSGHLRIQSGGRYSGQVHVSVDVNVGLVSAGLSVNVAFSRGDLTVVARGRVTVSVAVAGARGTLSGYYIGEDTGRRRTSQRRRRRGVVLTAEVEYFTGWLPWTTWDTYALISR